MHLWVNFADAGRASSLGVSREIVRSQLKSVLAETGASRQVDLAALLVGADFPRE